MTKIVKLAFDTDALIKLIKAEFPKNIFKKIQAVISEEVYNESVTQGKQRFYKDAEVIEQIEKEGYIRKVKSKESETANNLLKEAVFGRGEISTLHLYFNIKADAIISDDKAFLIFLKRNNIKFIIPADLIYILHKKGLLNKEEALKIIDKLRMYIDEGFYNNIKTRLEGEK